MELGDTKYQLINYSQTSSFNEIGLQYMQNGPLAPSTDAWQMDTTHKTCWQTW